MSDDVEKAADDEPERKAKQQQQQDDKRERNMPDIGGVEVVEFVRSQEALRTLPILVVTTRGDEGSRNRVLEAGASRFLTKPFAPETILAEARSLLGSHAAPAR